MTNLEWAPRDRQVGPLRGNPIATVDATTVKALGLNMPARRH